jgi:hypothetical protein
MLARMDRIDWVHDKNSPNWYGIIIRWRLKLLNSAKTNRMMGDFYKKNASQSDAQINLLHEEKEKNIAKWGKMAWNKSRLAAIPSQDLLSNQLRWGVDSFKI